MTRDELVGEVEKAFALLDKRQRAAQDEGGRLARSATSYRELGLYDLAVADAARGQASFAEGQAYAEALCVLAPIIAKAREEATP